MSISIKSLTIENFKCFGAPVTIPFRPITMLFGGNSAGKSTVLKALLYFREALRIGEHPAKANASGGQIDFGSFKDVVHGHDEKKTIRIRIDCELLEIESDNDKKRGAKGVKSTLARIFDKEFSTLSIEVQILNQSVYVTLWFDDERICWVDMSGGCIELNTDSRLVKDAFLDWDRRGDEDWFTQEQLESIELGIWSGQHFSFFEPWDEIRFGFEPPQTTTSDSTLRDLHDEFNAAMGINAFKNYIYYTAATPIKAVVTRLASALRYVGPLRKLPGRNQDLEIIPRRRWYNGMAAWRELSMILAHEHPYYIAGHLQLWDDKPAAAKSVPQYQAALSEIGKLDLGYKLALKTIGSFEIPSSVEPAAIISESVDSKSKIVLDADKLTYFKTEKKLCLIDPDSGIEVQPCDVGTGVSQALPIAVGAFAEGCSIMMVEQPELHLHPRLQCNLADTFITNMHRHEDRIFLLETHSEHLILRLLRRMREAAAGKVPEGMELTPDDVVVLAFEAGKDGTEIHHMEISETGELLTPWPNGFFPERMIELLGE